MFRLQNICSSCALQAGFADKTSAWSPGQAALLGVWRPGFNPVRGTASPGAPGNPVCEGRGGSWRHGEPGRAGPAGQNTGTCWVLSLPSFVPSAPWEWHKHSDNTREARSVCSGWGGQDEDPPLLRESTELWSTQVGKQQDEAGRSSSISPARRACLLWDESPKAACELGPWDWQFAGLPAKPRGQMFLTSLKTTVSVSKHHISPSSNLIKGNFGFST